MNTFLCDYLKVNIHEASKKMSNYNLPLAQRQSIKHAKKYKILNVREWDKPKSDYYSGVLKREGNAGETKR